MAKISYKKYKNQDVMDRQLTKEKLRHHRKDNKKNSKYVKKEVHKKFENTKNEKNLIIKYYKQNNLTKFYIHLKYLQELQKDDKKHLVKSLCDISKEINNINIKLKILKIAYEAYEAYDYDTVTLNSYGTFRC